MKEKLKLTQSLSGAILREKETQTYPEFEWCNTA